MTRNRIPRAILGGGDAADAPDAPDGAGRELCSTAGEGAPGRPTGSGAGGKLRNTDSSLRRVNPVRGGTSPAL